MGAVIATFAILLTSTLSDSRLCNCRSIRCMWWLLFWFFWHGFANAVWHNFYANKSSNVFDFRCCHFEVFDAEHAGSCALFSFFPFLTLWESDFPYPRCCLFFNLFFMLLKLLKCCFTSTEIIGHRLIRDGSPGRPPRLSHSSWAVIMGKIQGDGRTEFLDHF